ncbi:hypothetical protein XVE_0113 [Xanthomonas vesicatoria ATCC 35937]|uniref:Uncharacterized protein n=1 Tax=Xanthomonas vesicatoria ATCC 35937 TaxID=925775 RepID=F0B7R9_9XANT|nr:hypothetical protein XVE_0113 [Xanthomonas vesicatoria ATCC 35937]
MRAVDALKQRLRDAATSLAASDDLHQSRNAADRRRVGQRIA